MYHLWTNHDKLISEKEVEVENAPEAISEFQARSPSLYAASAPVPPLSQKSTPERPELLLVLSSQSLGFRKTHVALSENTKFGDPLHLACAPTGEVAAELSCDGPCQRATRSGATPRDV